MNFPFYCKNGSCLYKVLGVTTNRSIVSYLCDVIKYEKESSFYSFFYLQDWETTPQLINDAEPIDENEYNKVLKVAQMCDIALNTAFTSIK